MTNIAKTVNDYLIDKLDCIDVIYNDIFPFPDGDCLISRHDPGRANEVTYIDGSAEGLLPLAYYMRSDEAEKARAVLTAIVDTLDGVQLQIVSGTKIICEAVTLPSFVQVDGDLVIYTAEINCSYTRKGE